jgi:release factor glutamine methyltransferase
MTIAQKFSETKKQLEIIYSQGEAEAMGYMLFEHFTNLNKTELKNSAEKNLETATQIKIDDAVLKLAAHKPIQYILKQAWFYNLKFLVSPAVLIPRPETEELVFEAIAFLKNNISKKVIDIGTGSGCIPITIKKNIPTTNVSAIDISIEALDIAKQNAYLNETEINFMALDFLEETNYTALEKYDLVISNPPYIPITEKLEKNVTDFEPHLALFVPENDPLIFYKKIERFAKNHLVKNGKIMLEVHENYAQQTAQIFVDKKYDVIIKKDMQRKERIIIISHYL